MSVHSDVIWDFEAMVQSYWFQCSCFCLGASWWQRMVHSSACRSPRSDPWVRRREWLPTPSISCLRIRGQRYFSDVTVPQNFKSWSWLSTFFFTCLWNSQEWYSGLPINCRESHNIFCFFFFFLVAALSYSYLLHALWRISHGKELRLGHSCMSDEWVEMDSAAPVKHSQL